MNIGATKPLMKDTMPILSDDLMQELKERTINSPSKDGICTRKIRRSSNEGQLLSDCWFVVNEDG